ncbi:dimethylaniline monooxygenase [N-oxide-forming] 2-like [Rhinophrynus dorsalis]
MVKSVAVIGAGISGLSAIKSCLEEGLEPTCFERSDDIGGLWRFLDKVEDGRASIYKSLVTNVSKETIALSDFPMPDDFPNFLPHAKYFEYCKLYAENFNLLKYIKFKRVVCSVQRHSDFPLTGQWVVVTDTNGEKETDIFDAVMICIGQHEKPLLPLTDFPGIENFKGKILHSREYKTPFGFDGKQVLIVGMGNSGVDIATELCTRASQVYLSSRKGVWVFRRLGDGGYPWDMMFITRFNIWLQNIVPPSVARWLFKNYMNNQFNHHLYSIQPEGTVWKEPLVNEELPSHILSGSIVIKPEVKEFTESSVCFGDGTRVDNIDVVVFATGYSFSFPFLEESVIKVNDSKGFLYKKIFPIDLQKPTLAVIGLVLPIGSIMVTTELQNRWATRMLKGLLKFPNAEEITDDMAMNEKLREKWFATSEGNSRRTDYISYLDDLASQIGVKPNIPKLFLTDPVLALKIFFGPFNSYQYRLTGPGKWAGAREAILTQWDRVKKPLRTRIVKEDSSLPFSSLLLWFVCMVVVLTSIWIKL